jgi:hypothetical protein
VVRFNADYGAQWIEATDRTLTFKFYDRAGALIDSYTLGKAGGGAPGAPQARDRLPSGG